ncbi:MAG: hypothetical protein HW391_378 [Chloroflexi bacterium]|nr:hypothetical protein [Chloroflexota bacterium]
MEIALLLIVGGVVVGTFGSLLGLGGGVLLVPLLTLGFNLPLREAVGVSLVCVIVTSGASASVFLDRGVANLRLGMALELFTAIGALLGGTIAFLLDERLVAGLFALVLIYAATTMLRLKPAASEDVATPTGEGPTGAPAPAGRLMAGLSGPNYRVRAPIAGATGGVFAGTLSAILGIGGGLVMVPLMHIAMGVPLRIATATSNLMIGVTASASAIVYLLRGGIDPYAAAPSAVGVFVGAAVGSRLAHRVDVRVLRVLFAGVLAWTAFLMLRRAAGLG